MVAQKISHSRLCLWDKLLCQMWHKSVRKTFWGSFWWNR